MALIEHNTLWREQENHVKIAPVITILSVVFQWIKPRRHPHIKDLNAHYARDIGLSDSDVAYYKHQLPSQNAHHPRG